MYSEEEFLVKLRKRDEDTYHHIINQYSRLLWAVAAEILFPNEQNIEECVSDVFIALWNKPKKFDPARGTLKTYLIIMTRSRALNIMKKYTRDTFLNIDDYTDISEDSMDRAIDHMCKQDGYQLLYQAIDKLQYPTNEIIIRRYFYNEKPKKIAEKLLLTNKEVENRLYRGKRKLAGILLEYKEEFFNEL